MSETTQTTFYDAAGNEVSAEKAVRAERTTRSEEGTVLAVDYFVVFHEKETGAPDDGKPVNHLK